MTDNITFATTSEWKIDQARDFLADYGITVQNPPSFEEFEGQKWTKEPGGVDEYAIEIQSDSFEEVTEYKAYSASQRLDQPVIVEDTGVHIDSLNGFPGPYSKYAILTIGVDGVVKLMEEQSDRTAEYVSVVGYCTPGEEPRTFVAEQPGEITRDQRIDPENPWADALLNPIFSPDEIDDKTLSEVPPDRITELDSYPMKNSTQAFGDWYTSR